MLESSGLAKYRGYILYGRSAENILQRVVAFADRCENVVVDVELKDVLARICKSNFGVVELKSYEDVDRAVIGLEEGKALVFAVDSPRDDVYAVALVPIDKFNKSRAGKGV